MRFKRSCTCLLNCQYSCSPVLLCGLSNNLAKYWIFSWNSYPVILQAVDDERIFSKVFFVSTSEGFKMVFSILCGGVAGVCFLGFCFYLVLDRFSELEHVQRSERTRLYHAACKAQSEREQYLLDELRFERWKASRLAAGESVTIKAPAGYQRPQNTITTRPVFDPSKVW